MRELLELLEEEHGPDSPQVQAFLQEEMEQSPRIRVYPQCQEDDDTMPVHQGSD